jgi:uncharacterized C2H2 Zn-finger protein
MKCPKCGSIFVDVDRRELRCLVKKCGHKIDKSTKAYKKWLKENTYVTSCNPYEVPVRYVKMDKATGPV